MSKGRKVGIPLSLVALGLATIIVPMFGDWTPRLLARDAWDYGSQTVDRAIEWESIPSLLMPTLATDESNGNDTDATDESPASSDEGTGSDAVITMPPLQVVAGSGVP